jgi:hypothetical protein
MGGILTELTDGFTQGREWESREGAKEARGTTEDVEHAEETQGT